MGAVLGLSAFYHDAAAVLLLDGQIAAAAQEERFSRIKQDPAFPRQAIAACLKTAGLTPRDIEVVAFYEKPLLKLDRVLETMMDAVPQGRRALVDTLPAWFSERLRVESLIASALDGLTPRIVYIPHHRSHAASAFFASPFDEAAILTIDGVGEWTTNAIAHGKAATITPVKELRYPHSLGLLYSVFTAWLGFAINEGEYKVMGLAPYGTPRFADLITRELIDIHDDGGYALAIDKLGYMIEPEPALAALTRLLGAPARAKDAPLTPLHFDVAASIQQVCEQVVRKQALYATHLLGLDRLCMAGGVALNSVANGKLLREPTIGSVWVQPASGDAGGALGAALCTWFEVLGQSRTPSPRFMRGTALGPVLSEEEVTQALADASLEGEKLDRSALLARVSDLLIGGAAVGWVQGRMEFGPRALGQRSILADARHPQAQSRVNQQIKFRESFRPFAPIISLTHASEWFDLPGESPFMLFVVPVAPQRRKRLSPEDEAQTGLNALRVLRSEIPAVTHVDGSARVQTVTAEDHPEISALLDVFARKTGVPVLLNTSFNLRDEPIVANASDAVASFLASGLDALVLGEHLVLRPAGRTPTGTRPPPPPAPSPDTRELRHLGFGFSALFALFAGLLWWREAPLPLLLALWTCAGTSALLTALRPRLWLGARLRMAPTEHRLRRIQAHVVISLLFWVVIVPVAWARRLFSAPRDTPPASWIDVKDPAIHPDRMY